MLLQLLTVVLADLSPPASASEMMQMIKVRAMLVSVVKVFILMLVCPFVLR